jgi:ABC-type glycerol-3-phosphate transport system substrate-binding protein
MLLDGSWRAPDLERSNPALDFAIAPLPRHRHRAVVSGSVLWAVSAHSRDRETAWRMIRWMTSPQAALLYWDALRVAPPARVSVLASAQFRSTSGLVGPDGTVHVPAMPESRFAGRGAWLLEGVRPDPQTGAAPAFVPVAPYQPDLEDAIAAMLKRAVDPGRSEPLEVPLRRAADQVHQIIDRDRAARRRPAVVR